MKVFTLATVIAIAALAGGAVFAQDAAKPERTERMMQHMAKMFEMVDTDKDGAVSKEEHRTFSDARFAEMDSDKNGKVTQEEMHAHHMQKWKDKKANAPKAETAPKE